MNPFKEKNPRITQHARYRCAERFNCTMSRSRHLILNAIDTCEWSNSKFRYSSKHRKDDVYGRSENMKMGLVVNGNTVLTVFNWDPESDEVL
jgi:hypothetical protein